MNLINQIKSSLPVFRRTINDHLIPLATNPFSKNYRHMASKKSYSQDGEDMLLSSIYESNANYKGFYVDIGAHHPLRFSNTQYFYEKGWRGINIDATPGSMNEFNRLRPKDINIECAISDSKGKLMYYCFEESALNSFDFVLSETRIKQGFKLKEKIEIPTYTINTILSEYLPANKNIDFIDIDVEGMEMQILQMFDFKKFAPKFFLIEELNCIQSILCDINSDLMIFMKGKNYYPIMKCKRTIIYARESEIKKID
jgi:FkbM family methyltransferase